MNRLVRLRSAAEEDISSCAQFLQYEGSSEVAIHFLDALDATFALLQISPEIGSVCHFKNALLKGIRVWPVSIFKNYLIFYRLTADEIEVIRVLHGARDLDSIFAECEL